ncbi:MAG TPA: energy transducer TonB, partial [Myxococcaceae bacterium]|nr:energy transducer TonB [Myxococcaceae bacterium]
GDGGARGTPEFSGAMTPPVALTPINWDFPKDAFIRDGALSLKCVLDVDGRVDGCEVLRSLPGVTDLAIEKLRHARFSPVTLEGKPVRVSYVFNIFLSRDGPWRPEVKPLRWRPTPSPELKSACAAPNGQVCRRVALSFLHPDAGAPDPDRAGRLLAAACGGGFEDACAQLDTSFRPPQLISGVPARPISPGPGLEGVLMCRVTPEGRSRECVGPGGPVSDWLVARMLEARFVPATFEGTPFETDLGIPYSFRHQP